MSPSTSPASWNEWIKALRPVRRVASRRALAERFSGLRTDRLDLAGLVGPRQRDAPVYRWVPYKEAFAPALVRAILDHTGARGRLVDPFCGTGTSLLVAAERGMAAHGIELLPYAAFAARTCLDAHRATRVGLLEALDAALTWRSRAGGRFPDFPVRDWAFSEEALMALTRLKRAIDRLEPDIATDLCRLALLTVVEPMSFAVRDGTSIRHRRPGGRPGRAGVKRSTADVRHAFATRVREFAADLTDAPDGQRAEVVLGDARAVELAAGEVAIFSPPYPNRYDYSATYQLELGFGFCADRTELRQLRRSQLRSHLECTWPDARTLEQPALDEFVSAVLAQRDRGDETGRVVRMVCGFFEDMKNVLSRLRLALKPGAPVAIVVATQTFNGEPLPTDLLLAAIAEDAGMVTKEIWLARHKGVAPQQRSLRGGLANRESVLILSN